MYLIESNDDATMAGGSVGRPKGSKDNPMNPRQKTIRTAAQQIAINESNSKGKKAAHAKARQQQDLEIRNKARKERPVLSFFNPRTSSKKPAAAAHDEPFNFGAPSLDANGQAVDEALAPVNIDDEPKSAEVNSEVANNQATKVPVIPTTFSSHPSIKTFDPKDINPNFDEAEDAEDIDDEDWEGLEDDGDDETTRDRNDQVQQVNSNSKKKKKKK